MKGLSAGLKVGFMTLLVAVLGFWMWKSVGERASGGSGFALWARFKDAQGLASKSRVVIAGLTIGEIVDRRLEGRYARVTVRIRKGTEVWSNAIIFKKSSSLLGEFYLEIDPGTPETVREDGTVVKNHLLGPGDEITNVVEAATTDELFRSVSETLPKVNGALDEIQGLVKDVRKLVNNQITNMANNLDRTIAENSETVTRILTRADAALANIQGILVDVKKVTGNADDRVDRILDNVEKASEDVRLLMADARSQVNVLGDRLNKTLDGVDETVENSRSITEKIDEDQGTLGRLVNDPTIADNISDITTSAKGFTDSLFGLQTIVGLRGEYNFLGRNYRSYVSIEARTRTDKFYLIELVADPKGEMDEEYDWVANDPMNPQGGGHFERRFTADNGFRFTFQFGKRWNWLGLRLGIKDSTGGVGADFHFLDDRLRGSLDVFDLTYYELPRVKFWASYRVFRYFYVYAGVDDILREHQEHDIQGDFVTGEEYTKWTFGLDFFAGTMLEFNDQDLSALLFLGGGALGAALQ